MPVRSKRQSHLPDSDAIADGRFGSFSCRPSVFFSNWSGPMPGWLHVRRMMIICIIHPTRTEYSRARYNDTNFAGFWKKTVSELDCLFSCILDYLVLGISIALRVDFRQTAS